MVRPVDSPRAACDHNLTASSSLADDSNEVDSFLVITTSMNMTSFRIRGRMNGRSQNGR